MRLRLVLNTSTHMEFVLKTWFLKPGLFALRIQASPGRKSPWRIQSANPRESSPRTRIQSANPRESSPRIHANPVRESSRESTRIHPRIQSRIQSRIHANPVRESSPRIQSANPVRESTRIQPRIHASLSSNYKRSFTKSQC